MNLWTMNIGNGFIHSALITKEMLNEDLLRDFIMWSTPSPSRISQSWGLCVHWKMVVLLSFLEVREHNVSLCTSQSSSNHPVSLESPLGFFAQHFQWTKYRISDDVTQRWRHQNRFAHSTLCTNHLFFCVCCCTSALLILLCTLIWRVFLHLMILFIAHFKQWAITVVLSWWCHLK